MRAFTFTYKARATASIKPPETVVCEGVEFSDKSVVLKNGDIWQGYNTLDEMYKAYSKHGKGTISFKGDTGDG
jgi:hypothetical protein